MTPRTEQWLNKFADYFGLQIEYVFDLPDNVAGVLQSGPDPRYIIVNARKSRSEQAFTIAHEMGHYVMHHDRPPWDILPWYMKIQWKSPLMSKASRTLNRWVRRKFGVEWQADLWAFMLLCLIGARDDLLAINENHPEKSLTFWCTCLGLAYAGIKRRITGFFQKIFNPSPAQ
jgi:hypothetical protein